MRKLLTAVVLLSLLDLGCSCEGDKPTTRSKVPISPKPPLPSVPLPPPSAVTGGRSIQRATLREPMEEIHKVAEEMSRRAQGRVSMTAPAVLLLKKLDKLPARAYPATFRTFLDGVKDRAKILKDSKNLREDFNSLVDSCLACHKVYSLRSIPPVQRLRVALKDDMGIKRKRY